MKLKNTLLFFIAYLLLGIININSEGFIAGTLVKTISGYSHIESLKPQDTISSFDFIETQNNNSTAISNITHNTQTTTDYFIKIIVGDQAICCAPNQKFYSYNRKEWIEAGQLKQDDLLMNENGKSFAIDTIEVIPENCTLHTISLNRYHTYCVTYHNIIAHNAAPAIIVPFSIAAARVAPIAKTIFTAIGTYIGVHFTKKAAHKRSRIKDTDSDFSSTDYGSYYPDPDDPNKDKNKNKNNEHPHGIYENAPYHHKNSANHKGKSPNDGQHCLDYSLPTETSQRIAIEDKNFVILKYTSPGLYHGYIVEWKQLEQYIKNVLIKNGFVRQSGKIIKQITEKWPT